MDYGKKIAALRKSQNMTQEDLGKVLSVTYQAVSKWERGESLPDFDTMSRIAKYFKVPLSYFDESDEENDETAATVAAVPAEDAAVPKAEFVGTCTECGKLLRSDEAAQTEPKILCKPCLERLKAQAEKARAEAAERQRQIKEKEIYEQRGRGFDVPLIISLAATALSIVVVTIVCFKLDITASIGLYGAALLIVPLAVFGAVLALCNFIREEKSVSVDGPEGYTRNISLILAGVFSAIAIGCFVALYVASKDYYYFVLMPFAVIITFTFVSQMMWGGIIRKIFTAGGITFSLPGFIFSLDIESILWMIVVKFLLGVLSVIIYVATTVLVSAVAMVVSVFTFIPAVISKTVKDKKVAQE